MAIYKGVEKINLKTQENIKEGTTPYTGNYNIIPRTSDFTISANKYLTKDLTIVGEPDFKEENISNGITIFGKTGTYTPPPPPKPWMPLSWEQIEFSYPIKAIHYAFGAYFVGTAGGAGLYYSYDGINFSHVFTDPATEGEPIDNCYIAGITDVDNMLYVVGSTPDGTGIIRIDGQDFNLYQMIIEKDLNFNYKIDLFNYNRCLYLGEKEHLYVVPLLIPNYIYDIFEHNTIIAGTTGNYLKKIEHYLVSYANIGQCCFIYDLEDETFHQGVFPAEEVKITSVSYDNNFWLVSAEDGVYVSYGMENVDDLDWIKLLNTSEYPYLEVYQKDNLFITGNDTSYICFPAYDMNNWKTIDVSGIFAKITYANGLYHAILSDYDSALIDFYYSEDGIHWSFASAGYIYGTLTSDTDKPILEYFGNSFWYAVIPISGFNTKLYYNVSDNGFGY